MALNIDEAPTADELRLIVKRSHSRIVLWRQRTRVFASATLLGILILLPFLDHGPLNRQFDPLGVVLVWVTLALLLLTVNCGAFWYYAWQFDRDVRRTNF